MGKRGPKPKRTQITWSADIAYAVGLIATDGCLSKDGRHIELTSKDEEQLRNFMYCIGKDINLTEKVGSYGNEPVGRAQFSDVVLYDFLTAAGMTPRKTHTVGVLNIPDEYFFDFIRGHHDGDGSFSSYYDSRWKSSFMFYLTFISASRTHIEWIRETLQRLVGVNGSISTSQTSCVVQLRYAKREALVILKKMYEKPGIISLSRKRLKIEAALRIVGESLSE